MADTQTSETDEILLKLDQIEHEASRARRAAETTRTIAIVMLLFFVGIPVLFMLLGIFFNVGSGMLLAP